MSEDKEYYEIHLTPNQVRLIRFALVRLKKNLELLLHGDFYVKDLMCSIDYMCDCLPNPDVSNNQQSEV